MDVGVDEAGGDKFVRQVDDLVVLPPKLGAGHHRLNGLAVDQNGLVAEHLFPGGGKELAAKEHFFHGIPPSLFAKIAQASHLLRIAV